MSLFDTLKETAAKQLNLPDTKSITVIEGVWGWVQSNGGISGVSQKFQSNGLQSVVQSWIGSGANQPISAEQIQKVLGATGLDALAAKAGLTSEQAAQKVATYLPQVIDKLTPNGALPTADVSVNQVMEIAKSAIFSNQTPN